MSHLPIDPTAPFAVDVRGDFHFDAPPPDSDDSDEKNKTKDGHERSVPSDQKGSWIKRLKGGMGSGKNSATLPSTSDAEIEPVKPPFALRGIDINIPRGVFPDSTP